MTHLCKSVGFKTTYVIINFFSSFYFHINTSILNNGQWCICCNVTEHFTYVYILCQSELGQGWAPAIINTSTELSLIKNIQLNLNNVQSYWVGGSTDADHWGPVTFFDYLPNTDGNKCY